MDIINSISNSTGLPEDQIRILMTILLTIPIGYSTRFLKTKDLNIKHIMNIVLGIFFGYFCMGISGFVHTLISSAVAYLVCVYVPSKKMAVDIVWVWTLLYMLVAHIVRTFYHDSDGHLLDYCVTQMILTTKLTSYATNLHNAKLDTKILEKNDYWNRHAIRETPSLIQFFGYIFFYPTYVLGPSIEFNDYMDFVSGQIFKDEPNKQCPETIWMGLRRVLNFILIFSLKALGDKYFPYRFIIDPLFLTYNLLYRFVYLTIASVASRMIYEGAWVIVNSTLIFCGYAYNGRDKDNNIKWDRGNNINILNFELASNPRDMTINWNISVALWLRHRKIVYKLTFSIPA